MKKEFQQELQPENKHPIESIMTSAMDKIKKIVETDSIMGTPVTTPEGITIIPVSKVSAGFVAGGGEYSAVLNELDKKSSTDKEYPFSGGSGAGYCVSPIGFLIVQNGKVKILNTGDKSVYEKLLEFAPKIISSIGEVTDEKNK